MLQCKSMFRFQNVQYPLRLSPRYCSKLIIWFIFKIFRSWKSRSISMSASCPTKILQLPYFPPRTPSTLGLFSNSNFIIKVWMSRFLPSKIILWGIQQQTITSSRKRICVNLISKVIFENFSSKSQIHFQPHSLCIQLVVVECLNYNMVHICNLLVKNHQQRQQRVTFVPKNVKLDIFLTSIQLERVTIHNLLIQAWNS